MTGRKNDGGSFKQGFGSVRISRARAFDRKGREGFAKFAKETQSKSGHDPDFGLSGAFDFTI
jgi:hypothetical protein